MQILNLTQIESNLRIKHILNKFKNLPANHSLILHFNHNLKHYYDELATKKSSNFEWKDLSQGPTIWEAKITKKSKVLKELTLGEMVTKDIRIAEVFSNYNLDFRSGSTKTFTNACQEKGLDKQLIEQEITNLNYINTDSQLNFDNWELDYLADYIVNTHHSFIKNNINIIYDLCKKVSKVHGENHKELIETSTLFKTLVAETRPHMFKEETILFPYIKKLVNSNQNNEPFNKVGTIKNPLRRMMIEHISVETIMKKMRELNNSYTLPEDACSTYQLLFTKLIEFEQDLYQHVHLENNILFPKTILLEEKLLNRKN